MPERRKPYTIRLSENKGKDLDLIARIEDVSVQSLIEEGIDSMIKKHVKDPKFRGRSEEYLKRLDKLVEEFTSESLQ